MVAMALPGRPVERDEFMVRARPDLLYIGQSVEFVGFFLLFSCRASVFLLRLSDCFRKSLKAYVYIYICIYIYFFSYESYVCIYIYIYTHTYI